MGGREQDETNGATYLMYLNILVDWEESMT